MAFRSEQEQQRDQTVRALDTVLNGVKRAYSAIALRDTLPAEEIDRIRKGFIKLTQMRIGVPDWMHIEAVEAHNKASATVEVFVKNNKGEPVSVKKFTIENPKYLPEQEASVPDAGTPTMAQGRAETPQKERDKYELITD